MKLVVLSEEEKKLVRMLAALGNPARLRILKHLSRCPECIVGDLVAQTPLAQATVSQHLHVLEEAGLIHGERAGTSRCCTVNRSELQWLRDRVTELAAPGERSRGEGEERP
jgi:DNA-binding transcriptional ArsR family regulator